MTLRKTGDLNESDYTILLNVFEIFIEFRNAEVKTIPLPFVPLPCDTGVIGSKFFQVHLQKLQNT